MTPRVSVIVPVKNRRDLLAQLLDGLAGQTYADFEVVVVDDGSDDGSGETAAARIIAGRPVVVLDGGGNGAVAARTLGVAHAHGEILAFTDSDCVPLPHWLEHGVEGIDTGAEVVNGFTRPTRDLLPLERSMASGLEGLYPTCNVFYRRSAYERARGFDQSVGTRWGFRPDARSQGDGFGEDTLLAWRVARDGVVRYAPDAIVEHQVFPPDYTDMLSRTARVAAFPAMVREVPELRRTLLRYRVQLGARTRAPVYATALAALGRSRAGVAAGLAWWAAIRLRELRQFPIAWRRRAEVLPIEMAIDVLTAVSLVVGSVRARTLVL